MLINSPTDNRPHIPQAPWTGTTPTGSSILIFHNNISPNAAITAPTAPITKASHGLHNVQIPRKHEKVIKVMPREFLLHGKNYSPDCTTEEDEGKSGYFQYAFHLPFV